MYSLLEVAIILRFLVYCARVKHANYELPILIKSMVWMLLKELTVVSDVFSSNHHLLSKFDFFVGGIVKVY